MNKRILWTSVLIIVVLLLTIGFAIPTDSVYADTTNITLTVDLSGTWLRDITVQIWSADGATLVGSYGNQHGGSRAYIVPAGTYDVKLLQGAQSYVQEDLDCSSNCDIGDVVEELTVDLSGTWLRDITVQLKTAGGDLIWSAGNQHGAVRSYNVLKGSYDLTLVEGPSLFDAADDIDCTGSCSVSGFTKTLTVDLNGTWLRDITVQLFQDDGGLVWSAGNQHGAVRTYNVLPGIYDLKLVQGDQVFSVDNVDCDTGTCEAGDVTTDLSVDLSGTWLRDITVQLKTADGKLIWSAGNQHGSERHYNVLHGTYDVTLIEGPKSLDVANDLDCTGETCAVADASKTLTMDLSGTWLRDITVQLFNDDDGLIWSAGNQHGAVRTYKVLPGMYDLKLIQGDQALDVLDINCASDCDAGDVNSDLGIDLGGTWLRDITVQLKTVDGKVIWSAGNQHGAERHYQVLKGSYDLTLVEGPKALDVANDLNCTSEVCAAVPGFRDTLTVDLAGTWLRDITVQLYNDDDGLIWSAGNQHGVARTYNVLLGTYDLKLVEGPKVLDIANVACTGSGCNAGDVIATLSIDLSGTWTSSITTELHMDDGAPGTAGSIIWSAGNQHGAVRAYNVLKNFYDVAVIYGGKTYIWDAVNCTSESCVLDKSTLTVKFPGISSVHAYVKKSDGKAGEATGQQVAEQTYKNNEAVFANLTNGVYDVVVVKGAQVKIIDNVVVFGNNSSVDNIIATMTVNFPGISSVHTYVKTTGGGSVDERTYKNDTTSLAVLKASYKVTVVKGAQQNTYDVDCSAGDCTLDGIVATMTVNFPGISSVHTYVKTTGGGSVDERTYKDNTTSLAVLKAAYKVTVVKGSQQNTYEIDCSVGDCVLEDIVATMTVNFPGINSVHTYVKTTGGGSVDERTYKNGATSLAVLKAAYKVTVVKGAQQNTYDVDCSAGDCTLENIVSTLTVNFPGINSVHTYVRTDDSAAGFGGGAVDEHTYQNNTTSLVLLKGLYDVKVVKGAQGNVYESVDCTGLTCSVDNIVATFTLNFPGKNGVHTYIKTDDGIANSATGGSVDERTYQNNSTTMALLKSYYDAVVKVGAETYILDGVNCTGNTCTYSLTVVKLINSGGAGLAGGFAEYYSSGWKPIGTTPASGVLGFAMQGAPATYSFRMSYAGYTQQKSNINISTTNPIIFQTLPAVVHFQNSLLAPLTGGGIEYYASGWKTFGSGATDAAGNASMELLPGSYSFRMSWAGYTQQQSNVNITTTNPVIFQTHPMLVHFKDSSTVAISGGGIEYYASGWKTFGSGSTDTAGNASMELLPGTYSFRMNWAGSSQQKSNVNIMTTNPLEFQTLRVYARLEQKTPPNNGIPGGVAKYYASGWKTIGTTDTNGDTPKLELLPGVYSFNMTYAGATEQKSNIDVSVTNPVVFQTVNEMMSVKLQNSIGEPLSGGVVNYYASGWKPFGTTDDSGIVVGPDLLPAKYSFQMTYAGYTQQKSNIDISKDENKPLLFETVNMLVTLKDSNGNPIEGGVVKYYASGWKDFGTTDVNGEARKELLPGSYSFQMAYAGYTQQQSNISVNLGSSLAFQTVEMVVSLKDSAGGPLAGGVAKYYASGWKDFGTTDSDGKAKLQLLPGTYSFNMNWAGYTQQKSNIAIPGTNPLEFQTQSMEVKLTTCSGTGLMGGLVKYYASGWKNFGATDVNGSTKFELLPGSYSFQMTWAGQTEQRSNIDIAAVNPLIYKTTTVALQYPGAVQYYASGWKTFTSPMELLPYNYTFKFGSYQTQFDVTGCSMTKSVIILKLKDHANKGLAGGTARGGYGTAYGTWFVPGSTDANGLLYVYQDGLQKTMSYEMRFNNTTQVKTQDVSVNSVFEFNTNLLTLRMETCGGAPIDGGNPRGGNGSTYSTWWFPGGMTGSSAPGESAAEFFPGTYSFEMQYKATADAKVSVTVPDVDTLLKWQTTNVKLGYSGEISYGGATGDSTWFTKPSMELLPGTYKFNFRPDNRIDFTLSGCTFDKSFVALKVLDENGNGVSGGKATPAYGGSWGATLSGETNSSGSLFSEIPSGYTKIRMTVNQGSVEQLLAQLTASNYTWKTGILRIWLNDHAGTPITDGASILDQGGGYWFNWGNLNTSGYRDIQLFPGSYKFRMGYNFTSQEMSSVVVGVAPGIDNFYFQTGQVISPTITQYSTGAWRTFTSGMELMPGTYTFISPSQSGTVVAGQVLILP